MAHNREIGLIGVGLLGSAMSERLSAEGWRVIAYDIDPERSTAPSPRHAAACSHVVLSLPNSGISAAVLAEIGPALRPGATVIDTTTGDPEESMRFGQQLSATGVQYLDATVGGNSRQVRSKDVILLVGGPKESFEDCAGIFAAFSRGAFHLGPWGAGARMKLVLNLVMGLNRAVLAEGLAFARASGFDLHQTLEILKAGPSYSRIMDIKGGKMIGEDFTPDARLSQHLKDVRLLLEEGRRLGVHLPLSAVHQTLLESAEAAGFGGADNSAVIKAFEVRK